VGHFARGDRKRKTGSGGDASGSFGACPSATVVAGTWLIPEKKLRTEKEINIHNQLGGDDLISWQGPGKDTDGQWLDADWRW
jgi:hypothetical protein